MLKKLKNTFKVKIKLKQFNFCRGPSPADPAGSTNSMAIMVEYDSDTPHFEEEPDKVVTHLSKMKNQVNGKIKT